MDSYQKGQVISIWLVSLGINYTSILIYIQNNLREMLDSEYGEGSWSYVWTPRLYLLTTHLEDGTEIEITFNNITGLLNSEYVRTLAEIDSRFHKLGYFIKHFVNSREIFDLK